MRTVLEPVAAPWDDTEGPMTEFSSLLFGEQLSCKVKKTSRKRLFTVVYP
jgi:hypothetical protein